MLKRIIFTLIILCGFINTKSAWAGKMSIGTVWATPPDANVRPLSGIKGYIIIAPTGLAQPGKGLIYHTHANGTKFSGEVIVQYDPPGATGYGTPTLKFHRWVPLVYGSNTVTNGDFGTSTGWTTTSGWTISGGKASHIGSGTTTLTRSDCTGVVGASEEITFQTSNWESGAGNITVTFGGGTWTSNNYKNSTQTVNFVSTNTNPLTFIPSNSLNVNIDNVIVKHGTKRPLTIIDSSLGTNTAGYFPDMLTAKDPTEVSRSGFSSRYIQLFSNGSVTTAGAQYITDVLINVGTYTQAFKAIYYEHGSFFIPRTTSSDNGKWREYVKLEKHVGSATSGVIIWAHEWDGTIQENFPRGMLWTGHLEVFNYPSPSGSVAAPFGTGSFNSAGMVTAGNYQMDTRLPSGDWTPVDERAFYLLKNGSGTTTENVAYKPYYIQTGFMVYNRNASPGFWLGKVP